MMVSGCHTQGWGTDNGTNGILDPPNPYYVTHTLATEFLGHTILTDDNLRLYMGGQGGICGAQHGIATKTHIFENLSMGKTFAETMLNFPVYKCAYVFYGDPTYHYPVTDFYAEASGPYTSMEYKQVVDHPVQFESYTLNGAEPFSYLWDFGNGITSTEQFPVHTFSHRGIHTVSFQVTDANQNSIEQTITVKVSNDTVVINQSFNDETDGWMIDRFSNLTSALDTIYSHVETIRIQAGTYTETRIPSLVINKPLDIIGEDKNTTIINITGNIDIRWTENVLIKNITFKNGKGLSITSSTNITISDSIVANHVFAFTLLSSNNCIIANNIIENSVDGIYITQSNNNLISRNTIKNNNYGVYLFNSENNTICLNNFIDNSASIVESAGLNIYNIGTYGNYYSDYTTLYPDAEVNNEYGHDTWSTPYEISTNSFDMFPLVNTFLGFAVKQPVVIDSVDLETLPDSPTQKNLSGS